ARLNAATSAHRIATLAHKRHAFVSEQTMREVRAEAEQALRQRVGQVLKAHERALSAAAETNAAIHELAATASRLIGSDMGLVEAAWRELGPDSAHQSSKLSVWRDYVRPFMVEG
ncbi:MAG TPA: hypothetical protein VK714_03725, partial [Myxococcota bacterium]|nr:hypothetical protein [Myxococcota bacterium]